MIKSGIIPENSSYELLDGLIILKDRGSRNDPVLSYGERIGRLTIDRYLRMIETGIIKEGAPYELLDGLLVLKDRSMCGEDIMSIGEPHSLTVGILSDLNPRLAGHGCFMRTQSPIRIPPIHMPEPDGAIVRGSRLDYFELPPLASAVLSVIEVAISSLELDRTDKGPRYAEAGIPQYVIVNLIDNAIEIYEKPDIKARAYLQMSIAKPGESVALLLADGTRLSVPVLDLLPLLRIRRS